MARLPRIAFAVLPTLDHFVPDLARALEATGMVEVAVFTVRDRAALDSVLAWTDRTDIDTVWFEFCWPPFPALFATTTFDGRRVVVRIHRIEAHETNHVRDADWSRVTDVIVVGEPMADRVRAVAPVIATGGRLHVLYNGLDLNRFVPLGDFDPFRIGWCGSFILRKNPMLALEVLHRLSKLDRRYRLHIASQGGDHLTIAAFRHLARRIGLDDAIQIDGNVTSEAMPCWHAGNGVLLSTSVHESFGYAIAEAAACGCDIAVLDHQGADAFWPRESRFGTVDEAICIIRSARPHRWRDAVAARFDVRLQAEQVVAIVTGRDPAPPTFDSACYWDARYRAGGTSGAGSVGRLARFKADIVNALVEEHAIASVIEFGCGDGHQLSLARYHEYIGVDVSARALALCRARFAGDPTKRFLPPDAAGPERADLALSLDVIYHLTEDQVFEQYMTGLFAAAKKLVVIYSSNRDAATPDRHVRHRDFSRWVANSAPEWRLRERLPNSYRFDPARPAETSFADFYVFEPAA